METRRKILCADQRNVGVPQGSIAGPLRLLCATAITVVACKTTLNASANTPAGRIVTHNSSPGPHSLNAEC